MIWTTQNHKMTKENEQWLRRRCTGVGMVVMVMVLVVMAGVAATIFLLRESQSDFDSAPKFEDKLREVCAKPKLPVLEYRGVDNFFDHLTHPDQDHCYSWVEFGGEKIPIPSQSEKECVDEVRKTKYICFNEEYKMTHDPCLVYSFNKDVDNQFERDMDLFSCEVHAFDPHRVTESEHVKRTKYWLEHAWTIAEFPYDQPQQEDGQAKEGGGVERRRSLDFIAKALDHSGKQIKFLKSDLEGREWILLRQIITNLHILDIHQIGVRLHIPTSVNKMTGQARHAYFAKLFQVFQGLQCAGYKYVLGRAIKYYKAAIRIPEMGNKTFYPAYEVNWAKVL